MEAHLAESELEMRLHRGYEYMEGGGLLDDKHTEAHVHTDAYGGA